MFDRIARWLTDNLTVPADETSRAMFDWCSQARFGPFITLNSLLIGLSFISIPLVIYAYHRHRRGIRFGWVLLALKAVLLSCGLTFLSHVGLIYDPQTWYAPAVIAHTATTVAAVATAIALWPVLPRLLKIPTPSQYEETLALVRDQRAVLDKEKQQLIRELNHRVRNNLQVILGSLRLQAKVEAPECRYALEQAVGRINAIARVHERIYMEDTSAAFVETAQFLPAICRDLEGQFHVTVLDRIENLIVTVDEGRALGMLVNELVTNAVKHGAPPVEVTLKKLPADGDYEVCVSDGGEGASEDDMAGRSLGMRLIRSMARQLGGEAAIEGATTRIRGRHYATWNAEAA